MRLYDLTAPWTVQTPPYPGHPGSRIEMLQHIARDRLESYAVFTSMHTGTHIDAPSHMAGGMADVASIPLERLFGSAVIVDLSAMVGEWSVVTPEIVTAAAPDAINPGDIVILYFGWNRFTHAGETPDLQTYFCKHPGPSASLVDWLIEKRIAWIGTDGPSFEHPFNIFLQKARPDLVAEYEAATGSRAAEVFPPEHWMYAHLQMGKHGIPHVDQLGGDIAQVAGRRIQVGAFPWRFVGGEASIARVVAFADAPV